MDEVAKERLRVIETELRETLKGLRPDPLPEGLARPMFVFMGPVTVTIDTLIAGAPARGGECQQGGTEA